MYDRGYQLDRVQTVLGARIGPKSTTDGPIVGYPPAPGRSWVALTTHKASVAANGVDVWHIPAAFLETLYN